MAEMFRCIEPLLNKLNMTFQAPTCFGAKSLLCHNNLKDIFPNVLKALTSGSTLLSRIFFNSLLWWTEELVWLCIMNYFHDIKQKLKHLII